MLVVCVLFHIVIVSSSVIRSVKSHEDVLFNGIRYDYLLYQVDYDEDVYILDNWPCSCTVTTRIDPIIPEEPVGVVELDENELLEYRLDHDTIIFKFKVEDVVSVDIEISNHWGIVNGYVAINRIPILDDYDFVHISTERNTLRVCPSYDGWNTGWWYILIVPGHSHINNHFQINVSTIQIPLCPTMTNDQLTENVEYYGSSGLTIHTIPVNECVNISVVVISDGNTIVSIDDYSSTNQISIINLCDRDSIDILVQSDSDYNITYTTTWGFRLRPITDIPPEQFKYLSVQSSCSSTEFLPPHEESNAWIIVPSVDDYRLYRDLPWDNVRLPSVTDNIPGRLSLIQHLTSENSHIGELLSHNDNCVITFRNLYLSDGTQLEPVSSFTDTDTKCLINDEVNNIYSLMVNTSDIGMLNIYTIQISHAMTTDSMIACRNFVESRTVLGEYTVDWSTCDDVIIFNRTRSVSEIDDGEYNACINSRVFYYVYYIESISKILAEWKTDSDTLSTDFVYRCVNMLFDNTMTGVHCRYDSDCMYESNCDVTYGRCNHTIEHLSRCWMENINSNVIGAISSEWDLDTALNIEQFAQKADNLCVGPDAINYRQHYYGCGRMCYYPQFCDCDEVILLVNGIDGCETHEVSEGCYDCSLSALNDGQCELTNLTESECTTVTIPQTCSTEDCEPQFSGLNDLIQYLYPLTSGCFVEGDDTQWGTVVSNTTQCNGLWLDINNLDSMGCYDGYRYVHIDMDKCACNGWEWISTFPLSTTYPAVTYSLLWNHSSTRRIEKSIDTVKLYNTIKSAIDFILAQTYRNVAFRIKKPFSVYRSISCWFQYVDEGIGDGFSCFGGASKDLTRWLCPFVVNKITSPMYSIVTTAKSVPQGKCQLVDVGLNAITMYQTAVQSRLSSQSFTELTPSQWTVIKYNNLIISGQILTNGIVISMDFVSNDNITVCINVITFDIMLDIFDTYGVGIVDGTTVTPYGHAELINNQLCFNITEPGTYIGIKTREVNYMSIQVQSYLAAVIYFIMMLVGLYQIANIVLAQPVRWKVKLAIYLLIISFLTLRSVYFFMYPNGVIDQTLHYAFFEIPILMLMVMDSTIIFLWIELSKTLDRLSDSKEFTRKLFIIWSVWNFLVVSCFIVLVSVYYWSIEPVRQLCPNFSIPQSEISLTINKAYVVFVVCTCTILSITTVIAGIRLIISIKRDMAVKSNIKRFVISSWLIVCTFTIPFTIKSILIIISTFGFFITPVSVLTLLEQVPVGMLMLYLKPRSAEQLKFSSGSNKNSTGSKKKSSGNSHKKSSCKSQDHIIANSDGDNVKSPEV